MAHRSTQELILVASLEDPPVVDALDQRGDLVVSTHGLKIASHLSEHNLDAAETRQSVRVGKSDQSC